MRHQDRTTPATSDAFDSRAFSRATKPQILARMLLNLKRIYVRMHSFPQARDVTELLLAVDPVGDAASCATAACSRITSRISPARCAISRPTCSFPAQAPLDDEERKEHEQIWEHVKTLRCRLAMLN